MTCLLALSPAWGACGKGTLQCSAEDKPLICDFTIGYVLNENKDGCEMKTVEGCMVLNPEYTASNPCLVCEAGKVDDTENNKCVAVSTDKAKENCKTYNKTNSNCDSCEDDYFLNGAACSAVTEKVDNCATYSSATACSICKVGYYLEDAKCVKITVVDNCYSHSLNKCDMCDSDYVINRGLNADVTVDASLREALARGNQATVMMSAKNSNTVCQKKDVYKCIEFETFDTCKTCSSLYMLDTNKKCQHYPEDPIANCTRYSNETTCTECTNATHYLLDNECQSRTKTHSECKTYTGNDDTCAECNAAFYLSNNNTECEARDPSTYKNCKIPKSDANECMTCDDNHMLVTNKKACLPDIPNCAASSTTPGADENATTHECTQCNDGYTLENKVCTGTPVDGCKEHVSNQSKCSICNDGKYLESETKCSDQNLEKCVTYDSNANTCKKCESLYNPNTGKTECVAISDTNCHSSTGDSAFCEFCKNGFYLKVNTCEARNLAPNKCLKNKSAVDDTGCSECEADHIIVDGAKPIFNTSSLIDGCLSVELSSGDCNQCVDNKFLSAKNVCSAVTDDSKIECKRPNSSTALKTNLTQTTDCEICNEARGYFSKNDTCENLPISNLVNCAAQATSSAVCQDCEGGTGPIPNNMYFYAKDSTDERITKLAGCAVQESETKCYSCNDGFFLNITTGVCAGITGTPDKVTNGLDWVGAQINNVEISTTVVNCTTYGQISPRQTVCIKCGDAFTGIVDDKVKGHSPGTPPAASLPRVISAAFGMTDQGPNHTTYSSYIKCLAQTSVQGKDNKFLNAVSANNNPNCAVGIVLNDTDSGNANAQYTDKFVCIRCRDGYVGTTKNILKTADDTSITGELFGIILCTQATANTFGYTSGKGFGYSERFNKESVSYNSFFDFSSCVDTNKIPLYNVVRNLNAGNEVNSLPFKYIENDKPTVTCETIAADKFADMTAGNANCAVAIRENNTAAGTAYTTGNNVQCVACKDGYKATVASGVVTVCTEIDNSVCTAGTKWLDACSASSKPYSAEELMDSTTKTGLYIANFDTPKSTSTITNCLLEETSSTKCFVCKETYTPSQDQSSCVSTAGFSMGTAGVGETALKFPSGQSITDTLSREVQQFLSISQIRSMHANWDSVYKTQTTVIGNTVPTGYDRIFFLKEDGSSNVCGINPRVASWTAENNCTRRGVDGGCRTCTDTTFIPSKDEYRCKAKADIENCTMVQGANDECSACEAGYKLKASDKTCENVYCKMQNADMSKCIVCADYSRPNSGNDKDRCLAATNEDKELECINYDGQDGLCVKCSDSTKIPINYTYTNANGTWKTWSCDTWARNGDGEAGYKVEDYTYIMMLIDNSSNQDARIKSIKYLVDAGWSSRLLTEYTLGDKTAAKNCIPKRTVANCKTYKDFYCHICEDGFSLNSDQNVCTAVTDQNCKDGEFYDHKKCDECKDGFYTNADGVCTGRTTGQNCRTFNRVKDQCSSCEEKVRFLDDSGTLDVCTAYTAENCKEYEEEADRCTTCNDDSYSDGTGDSFSCKKPSPMDGCKVYSKTEDACTECTRETYYSTTENLKFTCKKRTIIEKCSTYKVNADQCETCEEEYYYNSSANECRLYPKGKANCSIYEFPDTCTKCDPDYYMDAGACKAVADNDKKPNCDVYENATKCKTCNYKFVIKDDGCEAVTAITNCSVWDGKDKCKTCEENFLLNAEGTTCTSSGITNCTEPEAGTPNTCKACKANFYLADDKKSCTAGTIANCDTYTSKEECSRCKPNFILSADKSKCDAIGTNESNKGGMNCSIGSVQAEPMCDICKYGFKKDAEGACVAISANDCVTEDSAGKCLLCTPNFSMDKDGKCTTNEEPTTTPESVIITRLWMTVMMAAVLLRFF